MDAAVLAKQLEDKWAKKRTQVQGAKDAKAGKAKDEIPAEELASAKETREKSAETAGGTSDRDTASDAMNADLFAAAMAADAAWQVELDRMFGKKSGDARYDARGVSTTKLKELRDAKVRADSAFRGN